MVPPPDINGEIAHMPTVESGIPPYASFVRDETDYSIRMLDFVSRITVFHRKENGTVSLSEISPKDEPESGYDPLEHYEQMLDALAARVDMSTYADLFSQTEKGDVLVVLMTPTGTFSMKELNDSILGYEKNNNVTIPERHALISKAFKENGLADVCSYDYKSDCLRIDHEKIGAGNLDMTVVQQKVAIALESVSTNLTKVIETELANLIKTEPGSELTKKRQELLSDIQSGKEKFQMSAGLCEVESSTGAEDVSNIRLAYGRATAAARMAKPGETKESTIEDAYDRVEQVLQLSDDLAAYEAPNREGNVIIDHFGTPIEIFLSNEDNPEEIFLNPYLIQEIRKNRLVIRETPENRNVLEKVQKYIYLLNSFDHMLPFTNEELVSGKREHFDERSNLAQKLRNRNDLTPKDVKLLQQIVSHDQREESATSREEFHVSAIEKDPCAYINVDVLGLGALLISNYEKEIRKLERFVRTSDRSGFEIAFEEMTKRVGDMTTVQMREMRADVERIIIEQSRDTKPATFVGGDEVIIAVQSDSLSGEQTRKIATSLKEKRGLRVVIAKNERTEDNGSDPVTNHKDALADLVEGTQLIKNIETLRKEIEMAIKNRLLQANDNVVSDLLGQLSETIGEYDLAVERNEEGRWVSISGHERTTSKDISDKITDLEMIKELLTTTADGKEDGVEIVKSILQALGKQKEQR